MKPPVRTSVSVVLVIVTLIALPYLFFFFQPSVWFAISRGVSRDAPVDASQQDGSTASADPSPEVQASSDVDPSPEVQSSSDVGPSPEVQASLDVEPSAEFPASLDVESSAEVPASSDVDPSAEFPASLDVEPSAEFPASSDVDPSAEFPASVDVEPSAEVPASSDVDPSPEVPASSEFQANSSVAPSSEAPASSEFQANSSVVPISEAPTSSEDIEELGLESMLQRAATANKTVIITTLNQAWATPGTMIDVFLESFRRGEDTQHLLNHLVMVALDQQSFQRCRELHEHCFMLRTPGVDFSGSKGYMTQDFLKMMWRRMRLLRRILELGYNFVFTDADILWLRNPFHHFADNADFQISCDKNRGSVWSILNRPNCGYQYALSNKRTISMYQHWCRGGEENPNIDEQTLLKKMLLKHSFTSYKVKIRFLPTERFSGFCQKSKNMSRVVTMHANCCTGLDNKVQDLRTALSAWEAGKLLSPANNTRKRDLWHVPDACRHSLWPSPPPLTISANSDDTKS